MGAHTYVYSAWKTGACCAGLHTHTFLLHSGHIAAWACSFDRRQFVCICTRPFYMENLGLTACCSQIYFTVSSYERARVPVWWWFNTHALLGKVGPLQSLYMMCAFCVRKRAPRRMRGKFACCGDYIFPAKVKNCWINRRKFELSFRPLMQLSRKLYGAWNAYADAEKGERVLAFEEIYWEFYGFNFWWGNFDFCIIANILSLFWQVSWLLLEIFLSVLEICCKNTNVINHFAYIGPKFNLFAFLLAGCSLHNS